MKKPANGKKFYRPYQRLNENSLLRFLSRLEDPKNKSAYGVFVCDCGAFSKSRIAEVKSGHKMSCGCLNRISSNKIEYQPGERMGASGWMKFIERLKNDSRKARFLCACGNGFEALIVDVKSGHTKSCGCLKIEIKSSHGLSKTRAYSSWCAMHQRCYDLSHHAYERYGGAGVVICPEWLGSQGLERFFQDMGERPEGDYSIDRINPLKGYSKENCRWASSHQQSENRLANTWASSGRKNIRKVKNLWMFTVTSRGRTLNSWHKDLREAIELRDLVRSELGYRQAIDARTTTCGH